MLDKRFWTAMLAAMMVIALALSTAGCAKTDTPEKPATDAPATEEPVAEEPVEFDAAQAMIDAANKYLKNSPVPTITAADLFNAVQAKDPTYQVVDIRGADHYALGHIEGAINIPFATTYEDASLDQLDPAKKIVVVCYTGHTASNTNMMWNMLGYDAITLRFGMSGWVADEAIVGIPVPPVAGNDYPTVTEPTEAAGGFGVPKIDGYADVKAAIQGQAKKWFDAKSPATIEPADVMAAVASKDPTVQVVSVRSAEDYGKGHIEGAINIPWTQIADNLDKIDPSKKVIVYCYTGHTGGEAAMFLDLMGYNAVNMKFGMAGWQSDPAKGGTAGWDPAAVTALPVVK